MVLIPVLSSNSMELTVDNRLKKLLVIGDRVLVKPSKADEKTKGGLYLPPGVQENEKVRTGYVMRVGPGFPIPLPVENDEPWKDKEEQIRYVPLQVKEGDKAIFLQNGAYEIMYESEKYYIVPQSAILMVEREEDLFN
jgi:chaperonin GroES